MPPEGSYMAIAAHDHATHTNCVSEQAGGVYRVKLTNYRRVHQLRGIGSSRSSASSTVGTISGGLPGLVDREESFEVRGAKLLTAARVGRKATRLVVTKNMCLLR
jgi:hypothetical protein